MPALFCFGDLSRRDRGRPGAALLPGKDFDVGNGVPGSGKDLVPPAGKGSGAALRGAHSPGVPAGPAGYRSLLERAKLAGSVLPKLSRPKLARTLNDCLHVHTSEALVLIRDEKVTAAHSGEPEDYAVLPMDQLLSALQDKLDARFPGNQFSWGYRDHSLTSAVWTLSRQRKELLETYQRELSLRGAGAKRIQWTPALRFLTSDIGISSAKVFALLEGGKCLIHIGSCVAVSSLGMESTP